MIEDPTPTARRQTDHWHVAKDIPLVLVAAVFVQTAGFIWSIAGLYSRVDALVVTTNEMKSERYTKEDGRREREFLQQLQDAQRQRDAEQDRRISINEAFLNQLRVSTIGRLTP